MSDPEWDEYARIQRLVEVGRNPDEQLDRFLRRYVEGRAAFDLHDSRRWGLNLRRNLARRHSARRRLLRQKCGWLVERRPELPPEIAARAELWVAVRCLAGDDWPLLRDTAGGGFAAVAGERDLPVGTIKSQVSRARRRLKVRLVRDGGRKSSPPE